MQELRKTDPGGLRQGARRGEAGVGRATRASIATYDDETIAAVDKFRADKRLNYQGNPPGLVDQRFVDALKAAYLDEAKVEAVIVRRGRLPSPC